MGQARLVTLLLSSLFFTGLIEARTMQPPAKDLPQEPQSQISHDADLSKLLGSDKQSNVTDKRPFFRDFIERDVTPTNKLQGEATIVDTLSAEVSGQTSRELINKTNLSTIDNSFPNQKEAQYNKSFGHKMGSGVSTTNDTGNEAVETLAFGQGRSAKLDGMPISLEKRSKGSRAHLPHFQDFKTPMAVWMSKTGIKRSFNNWYQNGVKRVLSKLDRMPFTYGKRSLSGNLRDSAAIHKRARLERMAFGYGKRAASFDNLQQRNEKRDRLERMTFGYGKRNAPEDDWQSSLDADKRAKLDRMALGYGKRTLNDNDAENDNVSSEKRDRLDRMAFGYGKRTLHENDAESDNVSPEKRDRLDRMAFGYGKRTLADSRFVDELTEDKKRSRLDRMSFAFGKKAFPKRSQSVAGDASEASKKDMLDRMAFGYGKRGSGQLLRPGSTDVVADDRENSKRTLLDRMAFGYGKRGLELTMELDHSLGASDEEDVDSTGPCEDNVYLCDGNTESLQPQLISYDTQHEQHDQVDERTDDEQDELTKRARLDRMAFGYGKRSVPFPDIQHLTTPQGADNEHDDNDSDEKEEHGNENSVVTTDSKRARLDRMAIGYGKRSVSIQSLHDILQEESMSPELHDSYSAIKRARLDRMPNGFGKRAAMLDRMPQGFDKRSAILDRKPGGFGKRAVMLDRMPQGFGRRAAMWDQMPKSIRKRAAMLDRRPRYVGKRMSILARMPGGFGKRSASSNSPVFR